MSQKHPKRYPLNHSGSNLLRCSNNSMEWIRKNSPPGKGIIISSHQKITYPEITGYLIPTLIEAGEIVLAKQYANYLSYAQCSDGGFEGPNDKEFFFDSGQALRGLMKADEIWGDFKRQIRKVMDFMLSSIEIDGRISSRSENTPEFINLYALSPLLKACEKMREGEHLLLVRKSVDYYKNSIDQLSDGTLTHFLAYIIDGLIELEEIKLVKPLADKVFSRQKRNGSISAFPHSLWVCSTGLAQLAVIGYKLNKYEQAKRAIDYLCKIQNSSGGFFGSYGFGARYFPNEEISWANKYFIDAIHLKIVSFFDENVAIYPQDVSRSDGRFKELLAEMGDIAGKKILDAGCGKGRFASRLKEVHPTCEVHGVDLSQELLKSVPDSIIKKRGSILCLPYGSQSFDGVFCIEALEHIIRYEHAISELCRVLKVGGKVIIIDKNIEKLGRLKIAEFEQWFDRHDIAVLLGKYCDNVRVAEVSYDQHEPDGLFLSWSGVKKGAPISMSNA